MSQPTTPKDTPTHRYDLMEMRVDQIQGLVTILQQRRVMYVQKAVKIKNNINIANAKATDADLRKTLDRLEKTIARMLKDDEAITKLLNESRVLFFELSDGQVIMEKIEHGDAKGAGNPSETTVKG